MSTRVPRAEASRRTRRASLAAANRRTSRRHSGSGGGSQGRPRRAWRFPGRSGCRTPASARPCRFPRFPSSTSPWTSRGGRRFRTSPGTLRLCPSADRETGPGLHPPFNAARPLGTRRRPAARGVRKTAAASASSAHRGCAMSSHATQNVDAGHIGESTTAASAASALMCFDGTEIPVRAEPELHVVVVHAEHPAVAVQHHEHVVVGLGFRTTSPRHARGRLKKYSRPSETSKGNNVGRRTHTKQRRPKTVAKPRDTHARARTMSALVFPYLPTHSARSFLSRRRVERPIDRRVSRAAAFPRLRRRPPRHRRGSRGARAGPGPRGHASRRARRRDRSARCPLPRRARPTSPWSRASDEPARRRGRHRSPLVRGGGTRRSSTSRRSSRRSCREFERAASRLMRRRKRRRRPSPSSPRFRRASRAGAPVRARAALLGRAGPHRA